MLETQIVNLDQGAVNARILAREVKSDFRRVETASLKMTTNLKSAEGKRLFVRYFNSMQLVVHFISVISRTKLKSKDVERVEALIKEKMDAVDDSLNKAIDGLELLFKHNAITRLATYDTQPLELQVGVISSAGRHFFEMLNKFDEAMPLFQTLEIYGVISAAEADLQRYTLKRLFRRLVQTVRSLAAGLQKRMYVPGNAGSAAGISNRRGDPVAPSPSKNPVPKPEVNQKLEESAAPADASGASPPDQFAASDGQIRAVAEGEVLD